MNWAALARVGTAVAVAAALAGTSVSAQGRRTGGAGMPRYDTSTERTVEGTVEDLRPHQGRRGAMGLHLAVKTADGLLDVHVGPEPWLATQHYEFEKGDALEITGSMVKVDGSDAFLARIIKKGTVTMTLRNANGIPKWSRAGAGTN